ncbi:MAG: hypothetical protein PHH01_05105 [Patescibacteria group bacterium]|nr:hypothetical protein [Patescibacteria group bacterium]
MKIENRIFKLGILAGVTQGLYILLVGLFIMSANNLFDSDGTPILSFAVMITLFVFSAGLSGLIVFGYPVYLVTQKKFREAVIMSAVTLTTLLILFCVFFVCLYVFKQA